MLVGTRYQAALVEKRACDYFQRSKAGINGVLNVTAMERSILAELFERGGRGQLSGLRDRRPIERLVNKGVVERHTLNSQQEEYVLTTIGKKVLDNKYTKIAAPPSNAMNSGRPMSSTGLLPQFGPSAPAMTISPPTAPALPPGNYVEGGGANGAPGARGSSCRLVAHDANHWRDFRYPWPAAAAGARGPCRLRSHHPCRGCWQP